MVDGLKELHVRQPLFCGSEQQGEVTLTVVLHVRDLVFGNRMSLLTIMI